MGIEKDGYVETIFKTVIYISAERSNIKRLKDDVHDFGHGPCLTFPPPSFVFPHLQSCVSITFGTRRAKQRR